MTTPHWQIGTPVETDRSRRQYWGRKLRSSAELTPFRISLGYVCFGMISLFFSDVLLVRYLSEPLLRQIQALKGILEVFATGVFVYVLTTGREVQLQWGIDRLDRQRQELQVLHRAFRHNLRNQLTVVRGRCDLIREKSSSDQFDEEIEKILETTEQMNHLVEQTQSINHITDNSGETATYDLTELIPHLVQRHPKITAGVDVSTSLPDRATVEANQMFGDALAELLTNAIVHNDAETPAVSIEVEPDSGQSRMIEITVTDNGPGIPVSERDPLAEGREEQLIHMSGLGLWFVKWTVRHSDGDFLLGEAENGGTTAVIRVPRAP